MVNSYGSSFTKGHGADLIEVEPDLYFQPLICYEAIFPSILRATANRADLIIQITMMHSSDGFRSIPAPRNIKNESHRDWYPSC